MPIRNSASSSWKGDTPRPFLESRRPGAPQRASGPLRVPEDPARGGSWRRRAVTGTFAPCLLPIRTVPLTSSSLAS